MDLQRLLSVVQEEMTQSGHLLPMIILELSKTHTKKHGKIRYSRQTHLFALDILNDDQNIAVQSGMLYAFARDHCKKYPGWVPCALGYYSEGWIARSQLFELQLNPLADPDRTEGVIVEMWQTKEPQKQTCFLPIIRSAQENTFTRLAPPIGPKPTLSVQLESFLQGALDSQKPDDVVWGPRIKAMQEKMDSLPPEVQENLIGFLVNNGVPREVIEGIRCYKA